VNALALLTMVLVIAAAGLVYELVMAAVASYVLGDSVRQFSTVIGVYLSALGLGAYLSQFIQRRLDQRFVDVELTTALVGGLSAPGLFLAFSFTAAFQLVLYATVCAVGALVGLELPLLIRILKEEYELDQLIARSLTFDYAGALIGSLGFSLLLVPWLGLVHTSIACGLVNALVGLASTWVLWPATPPEQKGMARARVRAILVALILVAALVGANRLAAVAENAIYAEPISLVRQSSYQRIVMTTSNGEARLFLNGNLQFDSRDEHRYHEALVHPAMAVARSRSRVAIGGGGDGLAVREVLRWPDVESVTLVDLDPAMTELAQNDASLLELNGRSLFDPRVSVINADAMVWFSETRDQFDVIVLDFPDPSNYSLGKLYSRRLYETVRQRLLPGGALVVQSTSPLFAREAFWCVVGTLEASGFETIPYHAFVPSFGEWGFVLATREPATWPSEMPNVSFRYLSATVLNTLPHFGPDMSRVATRVNRLNNQALVAYYLKAWSRF
jgi:spermidine synthase